MDSINHLDQPVVLVASRWIINSISDSLLSFVLDLYFIPKLLAAVDVTVYYFVLLSCFLWWQTSAMLACDVSPCVRGVAYYVKFNLKILFDLDLQTKENVSGYIAHMYCFR